MSRIRSRMRSRLTRPSARASGPPGQEWAPRPNAMCACALARSMRNSAGHSKRRGSRLAAPFSSMTGVPAGDVDAADRRGAPGEAEVGLHRALDPQHLFEEVGMRLAVRRAARPGARGARRGASARRRAGGRWSPGRRRTGTSRCARPSVTSGVRPVGVGRQRQVGEHVVARLAPPVLDVLGEPLVEPRRARSRPGRPRSPAPTSPTVPVRPKPSRNRWWSSSGTPSRSATTSMANGCAYALMNSQRPSATNSSSCWSARRHMNASLSLSRFGVISRISSARSGCASGGSIVTMCSCIGSWSR